jgi:polyribonucleotide nucleotidyltransferase
MTKIITKSAEWAGKKITLETGKLAKQASASVLVTYGKTVVLCTITKSEKANYDLGYFPLSVFYQEKYYAAGKIPGGFFKREGRPTEKETLTSRLIDRPIRPLFNDYYYNDTSIVCTVLAYDGVNDPDIPALIGAAAALNISGIPIKKTIAGCRVGNIDGKFVLNPENEQMDSSCIDLVVAASKTSIVMVESSANNISEKMMTESLEFAHNSIQPIIELIEGFTAESKVDEFKVVEFFDEKLHDKIIKSYKDQFLKSHKIENKTERTSAIKSLRNKISEENINSEKTNSHIVSDAVEKAEKKIIRQYLETEEERTDKRNFNEIRTITSEASLLPTTHGSALFTRGETQAIAITTLGGATDSQLVDDMRSNYNQTFMLHYNFPPFSVGEAFPLRPPGRREIGHGKLAHKAITPTLPAHEDFSYTIRVVSEILESNGSSSMATVCATSLSLMDAGIPIKYPVAGIAMGLIANDKNNIILSDISGDEDHLGDMDFKVAGSTEGITALQMDVKIDGIDLKTMAKAIKQAREGIEHILGKMSKTLTEPRKEVSDDAPVIFKIKIPTSKIKDLIGPGGKVIRKLSDENNSQIDIADDGQVTVLCPNSGKLKIIEQFINNLIEVPKIDNEYTGVVNNIIDSGLFVDYLGNESGFLHISEFADFKIPSLHDYFKKSDVIKFKILGKDNRGRFKLSYKAANDTMPEKKESSSTEGENRTKQRNNKYSSNKKHSTDEHSKKRDTKQDSSDSDNSKDTSKKKFVFW